MEIESVIRNLRLQLLIERIIFVVIALVLIGWWAAAHFKDSKSLILVDGKPVACVPTARDARAILSKIKEDTGCNPSEICFKQDVRVERAPLNATPMSRHKAFRTLMRVVSPVVPRWAIIVNGKPVVAVPNKETAGEVLDAAKMKYGKLVKNLSEEPQFKENVTVDIAACENSIYRENADDALKLLFSNSGPVTRDSVYTVKKGDVAEVIAKRCGIKLDDLKELNPRVHIDHLQIGDPLRVKTTGKAGGPKLTVIVRDMTERTESVPPPVERISSVNLATGKTVALSPGKAGERRVKVETIYENGRRTGTDVVEEQILHQPVPRKIAVGIRSK